MRSAVVGGDATTPGETITWKAGANGPFTAWVGHIKDERRGVALLSNAQAWSDALLGEAGQQILLTAP